MFFRRAVWTAGALAFLGVLSVSVLAHEMIVKGTVVAIEKTRIQVKTGQEKRGDEPAWYPIGAATKIKRGDKIVTLNDANIKSEERVVVIVDHPDKGPMKTKEIRLVAHVTIAPAESKLAASERYTVRLLTEGLVATVGVDLGVPANVMVSTVPAAGGWKSDVRRDGNRIVSISWKVEIPARHVRDLVFSARNPKEGSAVAWKVTQKFADGTSREWNVPTKLVSAR